MQLCFKNDGNDQGRLLGGSVLLTNWMPDLSRVNELVLKLQSKKKAVFSGQPFDQTKHNMKEKLLVPAPPNRQMNYLFSIRKAGLRGRRVSC